MYTISEMPKTKKELAEYQRDWRRRLMEDPEYRRALAQRSRVSVY